MTNDLLKLAVEAHGGLARWNAIRSLEADMSITGGIWHVKHKPDIFGHIVAAIDTQAQRVELRPFTAPDRRSIFTPGHVAVESIEGHVIESRDDPRSSFAGHSQQTPWDNLHAAYFCSYALWTYLSTPFVYTCPGVVTEELSPWHEDGERWRRLKVTFPAFIETHSREQVSYFGPDGLLRRHDYTVDIMGGATGANYASNYREFAGIMVPTTRRVFAHDADGQKIAEPLLVAIDIESVSFR
ncbi:hypothetical protein [Paraburkholderia phosphatilytica]|uniref:hypothetical protein n=1 Tax=Paraburkholderia phosphatilytica TaxID=2282883 RepID=UPI000E4C2A2C|nr:hypothetical protein [Paraburkholderia phosphatilytica]